MTLTRAMAKKKKTNQTTTGTGAGADQFPSSSDTPITEVQSNIPTSSNDNVVNKTVVDDLVSQIKQQNLKIDANTKAISEMHNMISELLLLAKKGTPKPKPRNLIRNKRKTLNAVEFEDKRSKGLCYFCDETVVTARNRCCCGKRPRFYHIDFEEEVVEDNDEDIMEEEDVIEDNDEEIMEEEEEAIEDDKKEEEAKDDESEDDDDEEEAYVSMASTSKRVEQWQVSQPTRNWLELSPDLMVNILHRVGVIDILHNVQKVCTTWNKICKEPAMWRVIFLDYNSGIIERPFPWSIKAAQKLYKNAIDRSQGQLIDITMVEFCDGELLQYVADRSSQLRRLEIGFSDWFELHGNWTDVTWTEALQKLSSLEELSIYQTDISREVVGTLCFFCPMLKTLKLNGLESVVDDEMAIAIGGSLPELQHLELTWSHVSNIGLRAILDGCLHLESLDLRMCYLIDLKGELGKRCSEQIKCLQRPNDSINKFRYGECVQFTTLDELLNPTF